MATVYIAEDLKHGRQVAIKVMHPEIAATVGTGRFLREIQIASQLEHPHVLSLIDSGEADGLPYYVMPFVQGESMREKLEREGHLPIEEAVGIAREVADGLGYAHRQGVVHRDIKPANILLTEEHALIADFGLGRAIGVASETGATATGLAVGTPRYMSPEQATGQEVDGRTDIYALGCVLWEMLAGQPPYDGPTPTAILALKAAEEAPDVRAIRKTVSPALDRVLARAMALDPDERYPTAGEFAAALERPELEKRRRRRSRRARVRIAAAVVLGLLGLAGWRLGWLADPAVPLDARLVAVLPFDHLGGDPSLDPLRSVAAARIGGALEETGFVSVVDQGLSASQAADIPQASEGDPDASDVATLAARLGSGLVVRGEYYVQGDSVYFQSRVLDSSEPSSAFVQGPFASASASPLPAIDQLAEAVKIRIVGDLEFGAHRLRFGDLPESYEALLVAIEGVKQYDEPASEWDEEDALELFERAARIDPTWDWPVGMSLIRYINLSLYDTADSLRAVLDSRRGTLPPLEADMRLPFATALLVDSDRRQVLEVFRTWTEQTSTAHYMVSSSAQANNRPSECLDVLRGITAGDQWDTVPWCLHSAGRYQEELDTVRAGLRAKPDNPMLVRREAAALAALGRGEEALSIVRGSRSIDAGEWRFAFTVNTGLELLAHGRAEEGGEALSLGIAWYEDQPPSESSRALHRFEYGRALYAAGRWAEAQEVLASLDTELADDPQLFGRPIPWGYHNSDVMLLGFLGALAVRLGDPEEADRIDDILRNTDRRFLFGEHLHARAVIAAVRGDRDAAVGFLADALSAGKMWYHGWPGVGPRWGFHIDPDFASLRGYPPFEELIGPQD
jgi:hypothetical protein